MRAVIAVLMLLVASSVPAYAQILQSSNLKSFYCGDEPCPGTPNLDPALFALVCPSASPGSPNSYGVVAYTCGGSLGAIGSYPPIPSRTAFKSLDWNTGAPNKLLLHSGHGSTVPGWSYGQNLTQATLGATANAVVTGSISGTMLTVTGVTSGALQTGDTITGSGIAAGTVIIAYGSNSDEPRNGNPATCTTPCTYTLNSSQTVGSETITAPSVTWAYSGRSSDLYLDATTMQWMFPGLGFTLDNGGGAQPYTVTGVYPYLGYVSVIWAGAASGLDGTGAGNLAGTQGTIYSCSSSCTIGQASFTWSAY